MDRCTNRRDITEILLKTALDTIQSINQSINQSGSRREKESKSRKADLCQSHNEKKKIPFMKGFSLKNLKHNASAKRFRPRSILVNFLYIEGPHHQLTHLVVKTESRISKAVT